MIIKIDDIKTVRAKTHLGMAECRQALEATNGDPEEAVTFLMKKNAVKHVDTIIAPTEGAVFAKTFEDGDVGVILELNCQTDFAAKNENFIAALSEIAAAVPSVRMGEDGKVNFKKKVDEIIASRGSILKEKLHLRRKWYWDIYESANDTYQKHGGFGGGYIHAYNHMGGKIAVLVGMTCPPDKTDNSIVIELASNLAMQIAAMSPKYISKEGLLDADVHSYFNKQLVKQKEFFESQLKEDPKPKPQFMWDKIIVGKINKWFGEVCLLSQESILDSKKTVQNHIDEAIQQAGFEIKVAGFNRFERGEELSPESTEIIASLS